jgi:cysteine desulfurase
MNKNKEIYMDHLAASKARKEVVDVMLPLLADGFGNPHSVHTRGQRAAEVLERAREQVAELVGAAARDVIFTSTGSEANNLAVKGIACARRKKSNRVIISAIEHHSVIKPARRLEKEGFEVVTLPVDRHGFVSSDDLRQAVAGGAAVVSIINASTEIGTIEPVEEFSGICAQFGAPLHCDSWGAAGMIPVNIGKTEVAAMTIAGQNFGGPPGAAALVVRRGTPFHPLIEGGIQEKGLRAGQENIPAIAGMGVAAEMAISEMERRLEELTAIRDALIAGLPSEIEEVVLTGHPSKRLPHHASFCVKYIEGESLLLFLNQKGIMAASGSACTSKALKASHVLEAIGLDAATAQGSIVFTLGADNTLEDTEAVISAMKPVVSRLREMSPLYKRK